MRGVLSQLTEWSFFLTPLRERFLFRRVSYFPGVGCRLFMPFPARMHQYEQIVHSLERYLSGLPFYCVLLLLIGDLPPPSLPPRGRVGVISGISLIFPPFVFPSYVKIFFVRPFFFCPLFLIVSSLGKFDRSGPPQKPLLFLILPLFRGGF